MTKKQIYYQNLTDDLVKSAKQDISLPDDYQILPQSPGKQSWAKIIRRLMVIWAHLYQPWAHVKIIGSEKLPATGGYFIFANHTQPLGDVLNPLLAVPADKYYVIASQANWGIPVIGKFVVPYAGLPVGKNLKQAAKLIKATQQVIADQGIVMVYPEAHVWPYFTKIRPFAETSMHFPVMTKAPSFVFTTTYQRHKFGNKPKITIYVDGPFMVDSALPKKAAQAKLHQQISDTMVERTSLNTYNYYQYHQK